MTTRNTTQTTGVGKQPATMIRLRPELRARLDQEATARRVSLNALMNAIIETWTQTIDRDSGGTP